MGQSSILVLNDDILLLICDVLALRPPPLLQGQWRHHDPNPLAGLAALSATCKRLRDLACPSLFRQVKLGRNHWTWDDVRRVLTLPPPIRHIQHFTIDMFVHHKDSEKPQADRELATSLALFLQSLPKLQVISCTIPEQCVQLFQEAFESADVHLPTVKTLSADLSMQWLADRCPAVEVLCINGVTQSNFHGYPEALSRTTKIKHLEVVARWKMNDLKAVRDRVPALKVLAMPVRSYGDDFEKLLPAIGMFGVLEVLVLADVARLGMGFRGGPRCGNAYHGPEGAALKARLAEQKQQVSEKVAFIVFAACAKLQELWLSDFVRCTSTRNGDGSVSQVHLTKGRRLNPTDVAN